MASTNLPMFGHAVFYAYLIKLNGKEIGSIQKMSTRGERDTGRIGEVKYNTAGLKWKDILTGYETLTLDLEHIEFYQASFLQAIGGEASYASLASFNFAFDIIEIQYGYDASKVAPNASSLNSPSIVTSAGQAVLTTAPASTGLRTITYYGCVPKSFGKTIDRGTLHIVETMTVDCKYAQDSAAAGA